jgi:uncharacterized protein YbjT (DUF2867 family)
MKKAVVFGASGFIGSHILDELLNNPDYGQVTVVVRKNLEIHHPKLKMVTGDYNSLRSVKESIVADEIFIALGTTKKHTPDEKEYYKVDHDYPVLAAKIAKDNGAGSVFVVSSIGANAKSNVFYIRTKGEMERDIIALDYAHTNIFRPSMLLGDRKENRPMEKIFMNIWSAISPVLVGENLKRYRGIDGKDVARAMVKAAKNKSEKVKIYQWKEMMELLG